VGKVPAPAPPRLDDSSSKPTNAKADGDVSEGQPKPLFSEMAAKRRLAELSQYTQLKRAFGGSLIAACVLFTALLFGLSQYAVFSSNLAGQVEQYYQLFIHVNIMVFVGFGFLMTFLGRYGYGAVALNMIASAFVFMEAILILGATMQVRILLPQKRHAWIISCMAHAGTDPVTYCPCRCHGTPNTPTRGPTSRLTSPCSSTRPSALPPG
jgi:hypothetical protein